MKLTTAYSDHPHSHPLPKVAVVLNGNARSVDDRLIADLRGLLQDETLFVSRSIDQCRFIARHLINQRFDVVLCGGGDGTFTQVVSDVAALGPSKMPVFGVLRLGTGNALATVLGARGGLKGLAADLRAARDDGARRRLGLLQVEGRLSPFAGVGMDATILEDYGATRRILGRIAGKWSTGPAGYAMAIAGRSVWRHLLEKRSEITIRNDGATAYRIDLEGRRIGPAIAKNEVIYRGRPSIAAASTIPNYGFGLRLFPQAEKIGNRFQLRISETGPVAALAHLPALFRGDFEDHKLWDYACTAISISCAEPAALQVGGDLLGRRRDVRVRLRHIDAACGSLHTLAPCARDASPDQAALLMNA